MQYRFPSRDLSPIRSQRFRAAFSLIEMMVAVGILVVIILAVGVMFKTASKSIGTSQATLELMSNVRSVQLNLEHDLAGIDKNAFLVIRSRLVNNHRFDQISFISLGTFADKTGNSSTAGGSAFNSPLSANAAHVWYGQLAIETPTPPAAGNYLTSNQVTPVPLAALPSGVNELDFILGRHTTLLIASSGPTAGNGIAYGSGQAWQYYPSISWLTTGVSAAPTASETLAHITSSRLDVCDMTPDQVLQEVINAVTTGGRAAHRTYEADNYCYRFAALKSIYDAEPLAATPATLILNGYFRMNPIMLQGCSSFAIDWTDNATDVNKNTMWYGRNDSTINAGAISGSPTNLLVNPKNDPSIEPPPSNGDDYQAIFSFDSRAKWPKALRFRYHVADPLNRLPQGRDFVQVINLPS